MVLFIAAAGLGIGLVGQGDAQSGGLSLPERVETPSAAPASEETTNVRTDSLNYVVSSGSEIMFTVGEQLSRLPLPNDAVVRTSALSCQLNLDGQPSQVEVNMPALSSDQNFRGQYIRTRMFHNSPVASFTVGAVSELPPEFHSGETSTKQVTAMLTLNGIETPLTFDLEVRNDGDTLKARGRTVFTWDQIQLPVPRARTVVSIEDEVSVQVLLVAQPQKTPGHRVNSAAPPPASPPTLGGRPR